MVGECAAIKNTADEIETAARCSAKVLITGETGAGKEVVARLIHQRSARSAAQMVTVNCAGVPDTLLESELFGHARGSFTGAYRDKAGLLEAAPRGTVFLDEVGEMTARMQALLLRFMETGEVQRVGADRVHTHVDVRLLAATNRNLEEEVAAGRFREDLFFRLNVIRVHVPPLRERRDDVPLLVEHFVQRLAREHNRGPFDVSDAAMQVLMDCRWPGNVRQLKNVIERIVLRAASKTISVGDLPTEILPVPSTAAAQLPSAISVPNAQPTVATALTARMANGESFWSAVYPSFMSRDITRADLRAVIAVGLTETRGNYRTLIEMFGMPPTDYKRFLGFLRKHDCHLPFQPFRANLQASPAFAHSDTAFKDPGAFLPESARVRTVA